MIIRKSARLALLAVTVSALALGATPAMAAPAPSTVAAVAAPQAFGPPIHCDFDCPLTPAQICSEGAPQSIDVFTQHVRDRMNERNISEDEIQNAVRIGSRTASCDRTTGRWRYDLGMPSGGLLTVIVAVNAVQGNVAVTAWWN
ncbi:DUF4258 domain-containing protein [Kitasatospora mediocidica]|uniref:DUF4258 domain-containing protein n=1 Tax=Kitasatospora mediocidica TaxID=58352 RepID=UPI00055E9623|nr:DUF4258 domain-containing protein [Kitasatospora mediocidica]